MKCQEPHNVEDHPRDVCDRCGNYMGEGPGEDKVEQEQAIERQRVEWVFGLTGGELADQKWMCASPSRYGDDVYTFGIGYWYDGVPEYVEKELHNQHGFFRTYKTAITWGGGFLESPTETLYDGEGEWKLVEMFMCSGETECPGGNIVTHDETLNGGGPECVLCEAKYGEEHGHIYIGEGYEAVYQLQDVREFTVTWEIQVDAKTHQEAAKAAAQMLAEGSPLGWTFEVEDQDRKRKTVEVDKDGEPETDQ